MAAHFGLDIGTTSVKVLKYDGKKVGIVSMIPNPTGKTLRSMTNAEKITLVDQLKDLVKSHGLKNKQVVASISESLVFSRVMQFPVMSSPELSTAIKWELDQSVPFPPNEVETSWAVLEKPNKIRGDEKISVYVVAVPSLVSDSYVQLLELIEVTPLRLENELPALMRSFSSVLGDSTPSIIVNIGASGTVLLLAGKDKIFANYYLPFGGSVMTKLVADAFGLPVTQAESYKRTYGMAKDQLEGKMFDVLRPVVDNLSGEIKKMIIAYQNDHADSSVGKIILTGGGAYLLGLISYLSEVLPGVEIVMGDVFSGMSIDQKYATLGPVYAVSFGLATEQS